MRITAPSADWISGCAILMAVLVGCALVFLVALPLALSSPFPTPKRGEWVVRNSAFDAGSPFLSPVTVPLPMEPPQPEHSMLMSELGDPKARPEPVTFAERWILAIPDAAARAIPAPNEAHSLEVPPEAARLAPPAKAIEATPPKRPSVRIPDPVDRYLWEVYQRKPVKSDSTGDFTWKDPAAAKRLGMSLKAYVIGGMDPDFREQLYHAGRAMDASGIRWSMLSAFRDDYRQGLAEGFKARGGNSQHGGSHATGGYGHGRAIDISNVAGDPSPVWHWIDVHGAKFGLRRPMPGADPAHIQARSSFHDLAHELREARLKLERRLSGTAVAAGRTTVVAQADEANEGHRARR